MASLPAHPVASLHVSSSCPRPRPFLPLPSLSVSSNFTSRSSSLFLEHQRRRRLSVAQRCNVRSLAITNIVAAPEDLKKAKEDIKELIKTTYCAPILIRLGWHDAGTYDKRIEEWPKRGGANGSLRYDIELKHAANAGLTNALNLLNPIKNKYPKISWADLFQLASATAVEEAGGPKIPMKYGRVDTTAPEECPPEGNLPDAGPPSPADHLREVFYRMGLTDKVHTPLEGPSRNVVVGASLKQSTRFSTKAHYYATRLPPST